MTQQEQEKYFGALISELKHILFSKGGDYSTESDRLSNFKYAGSICGVTSQLNCLNLIATKVARLGVLLNSKSEPNNESIQDSVLHLINYGILLSMLLEEKKTPQATTIRNDTIPDNPLPASLLQSRFETIGVINNTNH